MAVVFGRVLWRSGHCMRGRESMGERVFTFEGARGVFKSFAGAKEAAKGRKVRSFQSVIDAEQWLYAMRIRYAF